MAKILIIGCGVIGATIAYELSLIPQLNITVIEANSPASGSTGAALGVLMGGISTKTKGRAWKYRNYSLQRYESLILELEGKTKTKIPVNRQGIVKLLFTGDNLDKWQKLQQTRESQHWKLEIWDTKDLYHKCPQIRDERIIAAVYSPQDRQINPTILTQTLVQAATSNGVNFQFGVKVEQILLQNQTAKSSQEIVTTQGNIEADWIVIAAGIGSTHLTPSAVDVRPVLGQAMKLKLNRDLGLKEFQPVITGNDVHIVPLDNQEYWIGATVEFPNETVDRLSPGDSPGAYQPREVIPQPELLAQVKQDAIAFCPALEDGIITETWSGKRPRPSGQPAPVIQKLTGHDNILLATGHYRNGILLAPATAKEIINLMNYS